MRRAARPAFSLLEVVIATALIAMLVMAMLTFFWQTGRIREAAGKAAARTQLVHQVLERISSELRGALSGEELQWDNLQRFVGDRRSITFLTNPLPAESSYAIYTQADAPPPALHDRREVTYKLWIDPEDKTEDGEPLVGGILRSERPALAPSVDPNELTADEAAEYVRHDLWSYEFGYLEFRYYDGVEWSTTWRVSEGNPLPHVVQITIGFDSITQDEIDDKDLTDYPIDEYPLGPDKPSPNRYTSVVRIAGADELFSARLYKLGDEVEEVYGAIDGAAAAPSGEGDR